MIGSVHVSNLGKAYKQYPTRFSRLVEWVAPFKRARHRLKWVLQEINFSVHPGEAVGIIGINGAGKSTLLEALCCGKPVISTELGTGTTFINSNHETGLTIKPGDTGSLIEAINYLLNKPDKRRIFGECGKKRVMQLFTAERMINSTLKLYEEVLEQKNVNSNLLPKPSRSDVKLQNLPITATSLTKKIKILRVITRFNIGGPAIHVNLLQHRLGTNGFESILVAGSLSPQEGNMGYLFTKGFDHMFTIPEMQRELNLLKDLKAFFSLFAIIRRFKPDIIHSHTAKAGTIARSAGIVYNLFFRKRSKMIHTFHGHVFEGYFSKLKSTFYIWTERLLATFSNKIIAISETQRDELVNKYRIAKDKKFETIKLGFNLKPFVNNTGLKGRFRKKLAIDNDVCLIGIIGRLVPVKNHTLFLKAGVHFIRQNPNAKVLFAIIGDGELRAELEKRCVQQGISEYVRFCGWITNIHYVYADLDLLVLTSINEGTPVSIIEAMASSVPVISTDVGGIKDLLGDSLTSAPNSGFNLCEKGLLVPKNNAQDLSNGIRYILDNIDTIQRRIVPAAREFVISDYHQDRLIEDMRSLYRSLLG